MAFCPHCGKSAADQATKCISCGKDLTPLKPAGGGGKFKGTMLMTPGQAGAEAKPPAAQPKAPAPDQPTAQKPAAQPQPAAPSPAKKSAPFGGTMIGTGIPTPDGPKPAVTAAPQEPVAAPQKPEAPPQPAGPAAEPPQAARPSALEAGRTELAMGTPPAPQATADAMADTGPQDPTHGTPAKMLAGDPMAAGGDAAAQAPASPAKTPAAAVPDQPQKSNKTWLWVGLGCLGMMAIACVGTGVAAYMGFLNVKEGFGDLIERTTIVGALQDVEAACSAGDCKAAESAFHPKVADKLMEEAKNLSPGGLQRLMDLQATTSQNLAETSDRGVAEALQLDATQCTRLQRGAATVIGCTGATGAQIIHLSNISEL